MNTPILQQLDLFGYEPAVIKIQLTLNRLTTIEAIDSPLIEFRWYAIKRPGYSGETGYMAVRSRKTIEGSRGTIYLHRCVMERVLGRSLLSKETVDHVNRNPLDNRRSNLRIASIAEQQYNKVMMSNNTSGYKGVFWNTARKKWNAKINVNKKQVHLGYFNTPEEAHAAYCEAAKKYHGEFANFG